MPFRPDILRPLVLFSASGLLFGVSPALGVKTLQEFAARSRGKALNFASAGSGSPGRPAAELYADATGARIAHIPYKGNAAAVNALLAGEVDAALAMPEVQARLAALDMFALGDTGSVAAARLQAASARYGQLVRKTGMKPG